MEAASRSGDVLVCLGLPMAEGAIDAGGERRATLRGPCVPCAQPMPGALPPDMEPAGLCPRVEVRGLDKELRGSIVRRSAVRSVCVSSRIFARI